MSSQPRGGEPAVESAYVPIGVVELRERVAKLEERGERFATKEDLANTRTQILIWVGSFVGIAAAVVTAIFRIWPV